MKRHLRSIAAIACALALGSVGAAAARHGSHGEGSAAAARPAIWRTYDMIVSFQSLPRTYTCDQLWYEFRGILLRLGARASSINVLPYDCSPTPSGDMKSPNVQVRFQLPFFLLPGVKGAPIEAVEGTVRFSPGKPKTLRASDCQLLQHIEQTMFASMPVKVDAAHFDCSAPPPRSGKFAVTLSVPVVAGRSPGTRMYPAAAGGGH